MSYPSKSITRPLARQLVFLMSIALLVGGVAADTSAGDSKIKDSNMISANTQTATASSAQTLVSAAPIETATFALG